MRTLNSAAGIPSARRAPRTLWLLCLAVLALPACAGTARDPFDQSPAAERILTITLTNQGFNNLRVYAVTASGARSLGSLGGNAVRHTTLDWHQMDQIRFRIEVLAGPTYNTYSVRVSPGDHLELVIPDNPRNAILRPSRGT